MWMGWGENLSFFYNDAYRPTLGIKHAWALGAPTEKLWKEIWPDIGPRIEHVLKSGEATWDEGLLLFLERRGFPEETYHTFSYSPLADDHARTVGMLCVVTEETDRIIGERRLGSLRDLASGMAGTHTRAEIVAAAERQLGANLKDLPFTLIYLFDRDGTARLAGTTGVTSGHPIAPAAIAPGDPSPAWPASEILAQHAVVDARDIGRRFDNIPTGAWDRPPRDAVLAPLARQGQERPAGFIVAGVNPHRPMDEAYLGFINLIAGQIAAGLANAEAYEEERRRAEALAEIDRAKTTFFSNVSHEFRTPLTLMLSPLEEVLARSNTDVHDDSRQLVSVAHRNGVRLLKLVNALLDFSRIEAGRTQAHFEALDLSAFTAELASTFRSAVERAGLTLTIDCPALPHPALLDRDMWEKVVLNLLSNALKFTFDGGITVSHARKHRRHVGRNHRARHRHRHPGGRAAASLRALPSRRRRAGPQHRGQRHRPGPGPRTGEAAWRHHRRAERSRQRQQLHHPPAARSVDIRTGDCRPRRSRFPNPRRVPTPICRRRRAGSATRATRYRPRRAPRSCRWQWTARAAS